MRIHSTGSHLSEPPYQHPMLNMEHFPITILLMHYLSIFYHDFHTIDIASYS